MSFYRLGALLAAASIVVYQCFVPPIVGLADNADFLIIASRFYLDVTNPDDPDRFFAYLNNHYRHFDEPAWVPTVLTSEVLLQSPAFLLNTLLSKTGSYDIRWAGLSHAAVFLLAIFWMTKLLEPLRRWSRRLVTAFLILLLTDVAYVAYFNSFYTDAASYVTLMAMLAALALFVTGRQSGRRMAWMAIGFTALFVTSKVQHAVLGLPLMAFFVWQREKFRAALGRYGLILALAPVLLGMALLAATTPPRYRGMAVYNIVFSQILPAEPDAAAGLRQLGLPEKYAYLSGKHAFSPGTQFFDPAFQQEWLAHASYSSIVKYYLRHPGMVLELMGTGVEASRYYRNKFGNFLKSAGLGTGDLSQAFAWWSWTKTHVFQTFPPVHWLYTFVPALLLLAAAHARRFAALHPARPLVYLIVAMAVVELAVGSLTDVRDTSRHLFLYNAIQDLMAIAAVGVLCYGMQRKAALR